MEHAPDIASIAGLIGDPARSKILLALMGGRALTATELSLEAGISPSTASTHLSKLRAAHLIDVQRQGRHRYFQITDPNVAELIEKLCGLASRRGPASRVQTGPKDPTLRKARVCYDHLAGELAVRIFDGLVLQGRLSVHGDGLELTPEGEKAMKDLGISVQDLRKSRRVLCRRCLDWSVRRHHLAGSLGASLLTRVYEQGWAQKDLVTRAVHFTDRGESEFVRVFGLAER